MFFIQKKNERLDQHDSEGRATISAVQLVVNRMIESTILLATKLHISRDQGHTWRSRDQAHT